MYCSACGKEIPDKSNFCMYCGFAINGTPSSSVSARPVEWEYKDFVLEWDPGKGGSYDLDFTSIARALSEAWGHVQHLILPILQKHLDQGWKAITEIGPAALEMEMNKTFFASGYGIRKFLVKLRRQKNA